MTQQFDFKKRTLSSGPHLLGCILVFAGILVFITSFFIEFPVSFTKVIIVSAGAVVIGLVIISTYEGTQIDFSNSQVREYTSFCGYKVGSWEKMPTISKVKVVINNFKSSNTPNGISPTFSGEVIEFKTILFSENPRPEFMFKYAKKEQAVNAAKILASQFNAQLESSI